MTNKKGSGSATAQKANATMEKPRTSSSAQVELGKKSGKSKT